MTGHWPRLPGLALARVGITEVRGCGAGAALSRGAHPGGRHQIQGHCRPVCDWNALRLRKVCEGDGTVTRKLGHKVRLFEGPSDVACTNFYLDDQEWAVLAALPSRVLTKKRHIVHRQGWVIAIDEHPDGTLVAEIDDGDLPSHVVPGWLDVIKDVSDDECWTGAHLAG